MATVRHLGLFPFCSAAAKPPLELSLEDALAMWWRVKRWQVKNSTISGSSTDPIAGELLPTVDPPANESGLVCSKYVREYVLAYVFDSTAPFESLLRLSLEPFITTEDKKAWVTLSITDAITEIGGTGAATGGESGDGSPAGTARLFILGRQYLVPMFNRFAGGTVTCDITIEPLEYWPFDPGDGGGPIYDSATGQQLRAFPN